MRFRVGRRTERKAGANSQPKEVRLDGLGLPYRPRPTPAPAPRSILSKDFVYRDAAHTDVAATMKRHRREMRAQQVEKQATVLLLPLKAKA